MAPSSSTIIFIIIIFITACLSLPAHSAHGVKVIQPRQQTTYRNVSASIRCEYTEASEPPRDIQLKTLSGGKTVKICQRDEQKCINIIKYQETSSSFVFVLLNLNATDMTSTYECQVTAKTDGVYKQWTGTPTRLLPDTEEVLTHDCPSPPPPPPPPRLHCPSLPLYLTWSLIGLLALLFLYSFLITALYIRLRVRRCTELSDSVTYVQMQRSRGHPDINSTYVEMKTAPPGGRAGRGLSNPSG
ncbi:uncharacterized protein LOC115379965 [Myripristis murdjan]|uniref:uncharacterized protein LOC115379965 n=1 Tax=Myripristis murdjan TaxID=586833 RepID=UPI00117649F6|nr:uncharacterized protein LOC115379965 [Myripristis murdjan]